MEKQPHVLVLAGPNGAGKTTAAPVLLAQTLGLLEFVNADVIAQGLSGFNPEQAAIQAGRIMLRRLHELADQRASFAFETTLASRTFAPWIADLRQKGYFCSLIFLWLPSPETAIARVRVRVEKGGHHVPDEVVTRRYWRGLRNFFTLYRPLSDLWRFCDNGTEQVRLLAAGHAEQELYVAEPRTWTRIRAEAMTDE